MVWGIKVVMGFRRVVTKRVSINVIVPVSFRIEAPAPGDTNKGYLSSVYVFLCVCVRMC